MSESKVALRDIDINTNEGFKYTYNGVLTDNKKEGQGFETKIKQIEDKILITQYVGSFHDDKWDAEGLLVNDEGDVCLSQFKNGISEGFGYYFWSSNIEPYQKAQEIDKKDKLKFERAFYGLFKTGKIYKGILFDIPSKYHEMDTKKVTDYLYFGALDNNGEKNDPNGIRFNLKNHIFHKGRFENNIFQEGYEIQFDSSCKNINKTYYIIKEGDKFKDIFKKEAREKNEVEEVEDFAVKFIEYYIIGNRTGVLDKLFTDFEVYKIFDKAFKVAKKHFLPTGIPTRDRLKQDWNDLIFNEILQKDLYDSSS